MLTSVCIFFVTLVCHYFFFFWWFIQISFFSTAGSLPSNSRFNSSRGHHLIWVRNYGCSVDYYITLISLFTYLWPIFFFWTDVVTDCIWASDFWTETSGEVLLAFHKTEAVASLTKLFFSLLFYCALFHNVLSNSL